MADLASLMNVAPITGGMMIGQQANSEMQTADVERQRLAQLVQELQLKNQQSVGMNPLLQAHQQLTNDTLGAQLPGVQARSLQDQLTAQKQQGTLATDITAGNSTNLNTVRTNKQRDMDSLQQDMLKYSSEMARTPVPMRAGALHTLMVGNGHNMDDPTSAALLQTITADPENMPQNLLAAAKHLGEIKKVQAPAYLGHVEGANIAAAAHVKGAGIAAGASNYAADQARASREEVQGAKNELTKYKIDQTQNIQQRITELSKKPQSPERDALMDELTRIGQVLNPQYGAAIDLRALQGGELGRNADRPLQGGQPAAPSAPPAAAVEWLKKNPALKAQFDAKYGAGASNKYLQ